MNDKLTRKISILSAAAKYDVSCSSSGSNRTNHNKGLGDAAASGICHSFTEDGRCISLLKILLTNHCIYDCAFCINRRSNDIPRAAFSINEIVELTLSFYRRNYIEGLFLSSGIFKNADYTMERLLSIVKILRLQHCFNGYVHLKTIPGASRELVSEAGFYADRMSINLEIPTEKGLRLLAPEKTHTEVRNEMSLINNKMIALADERKVIRRVPSFVPAGQSTQMVIGASPDTDKEIMYTAQEYYRSFNLKRVYYSGYIPVNEDSRMPAPGSTPPLIRENRLYQTDWLLRYYHFDVREILNEQNPHLDLEVDPKLAWALRNLHYFPVDLNRADYQTILRIPGIGVMSAKRIIQARKFGKLHEYQLRKMGVAWNRARHFVTCADTPLNTLAGDPLFIKKSILAGSSGKYTKTPAVQLSLF